MSYDSDNESMIMSLRDWRQALRTPPSYRIGNSSLRIHAKHITLILLIIATVLFILFYSIGPASQRERRFENDYTYSPRVEIQSVQYNSTYPLTRPIRTPTGISYRIAVISDLDTDSQDKGNSWVAYLLKGYLNWNPSLNVVTVIWDGAKTELKSSFSQGGRGMELSELIVFNGKLYTVDDRTGIIYEIVDNRVVPWVVLTDGDGTASKGFKAEWATIKDKKLYIGSLGKEWTNSKGEIINFDPQWIKIITQRGEVTHQNWRDRYLSLRETAGITYPGYMIHESCAWSEKHRKWFFLPRRSSKQSYRDDTDELMGTNLFLTADDRFRDIRLQHIGDVIPSHGFSSFKFIPGSDDGVIVAIKSEELKGSTASYIMAFTINGKILMPETKIGDIKYEGVEFV